MASGIADQLHGHCGGGFLAYDAAEMEEVFVIPCFMFVMADNPMANSLCCVFETGARHPCRICKVDSRLTDGPSLVRWFEVSVCVRMCAGCCS